MTRSAKLLANYLERENATTRLNYHHSLLDFTQFVRAREIQIAFDRLLSRSQRFGDQVETVDDRYT